MPACSECGQANPANADLCLACGAILAEGARGNEVRRRVTVVCADVRGWTELSGRIDPEILRRVAERYFARMRVPLERHGGTVEKFIGDAVLAVFGLPRLHPDDALRAVRAAIEMREAAVVLNRELDQDFGVTIGIGIGVNTGEVVAGDLSGGQSFATGEAVNLAERLEDEAGPGEILIGEPTYRLVRGAVRVEACKPLALRGRPGRTDAFLVLGLDSGPREPRGASPFVGRAPELRVLAETLDGVVAAGACRLVTVLGAAGIGKSRLAEELRGGPGARATWIEGRCLPYGEGITYWPLREAVQNAAGLNGLESAAEARAQIGRLVEQAADAALISARLLETLALQEGTAGHSAIAWAARRLFEELARERPLIVMVDDLQWAETTFLDLVESLARDLDDAPVLLLCLARPELIELRPEWGAAVRGRVLALEPLPEAASAQLVAGLLGTDNAATPAVARINAASEGNPFFVEELVAMLIEEGRLRRERGSWVAADALVTVSLPPTIGALLAARIDALPPGERATLERASVEGKIFHRDAVIQLSPPAERATLGERLEALVRKALIQPAPPTTAADDGFAFRHQLLRDAAYEALPKTQRAQLHERFAGWLERRAGNRTAEYAEILGYHLEQAQRYRADLRRVAEPQLAGRAAGYLETAGIRAHARGDMHAAASLLSRSLALLPAESSDRRNLAALHEDALAELRRLPRHRLTPAQLRCFWSWPLGHRWQLRERGGRPVLRCEACGKSTVGYRRSMRAAIDQQARDRHRPY